MRVGLKRKEGGSARSVEVPSGEGSLLILTGTRLYDAAIRVTTRGIATIGGFWSVLAISSSAGRGLALVRGVGFAHQSTGTKQTFLQALGDPLAKQEKGKEPKMARVGALSVRQHSYPDIHSNASQHPTSLVRGCIALSLYDYSTTTICLYGNGADGVTCGQGEWR